MVQQQRSLIFVAGIAAAVLLVIIAGLYVTGTMPLDPKRHVKHALLFLALAAGALAVANFNRPGGRRG